MAGKSIAELTLRHTFVDELPGDPISDRRSRQVLSACWSPVTPVAPLHSPKVLHIADDVAASLGLDATSTPELAAVLAGGTITPQMRPYAACYGGHQFGQWAGQLGDGRAITLGEVACGEGGRQEIQLKGAGSTPYSRRGDGRAVLRSSLRELVCSEAMHHLGVPTTRALSLALTGDLVERDMFYDGRAAYEQGAVVCRVAPSFLRFGNYEIFAARGDTATLRQLVGYTLRHFFPHRIVGDDMDVAGFLSDVVASTARMIVDWMRVGFVHGVMNTDNMSVLGLTIDYGPFGWTEPFDLDWTPNTTDAQGRRYAFGQQPAVAQWNLAKLARALLPLVDDAGPLEEAIVAYAPMVDTAMLRMLCDKLGLATSQNVALADEKCVAEHLGLLAAGACDMTLFYRALADIDLSIDPSHQLAQLLPTFYGGAQLSTELRVRWERWLATYTTRCLANATERRERMNRVNPLYVPRNYLLHQTISRTVDGDPCALAELMNLLRRPYDVQPGAEAFAQMRPEWAESQPGCATLSCSS